MRKLVENISLLQKQDIIRNAHNRWENICPRMHHRKMNCKDCSHQAYKRLTIKDIRSHLQGRSYNGTEVIGLYPLLKNGTCRFLVFDFDNHEKRC